MIVNVFKVPRNRPMVNSLASAKEFMEQCKNPFELRMTREHFIIIRNGIVQYVHRSYAGMIGIDFVENEFRNDEAVRAVYHNRKFINEHFRD